MCPGLDHGYFLAAGGVEFVRSTGVVWGPNPLLVKGFGVRSLQFATVHVVARHEQTQGEAAQSTRPTSENRGQAAASREVRATLRMTCPVLWRVRSWSGTGAW
jgi:hypothetical protein